MNIVGVLTSMLVCAGIGFCFGIITGAVIMRREFYQIVEKAADFMADETGGDFFPMKP